jgi:hypothetical protein
MKRLSITQKAEHVIEMLHAQGLSLPATMRDIRQIFDVRDLLLIRELGRLGALASPELYDGGLPLGTAEKLEALGIRTKNQFRNKYLQNQLNPTHLQHVGAQRSKSILLWAGLVPEADMIHSFKMSVPAGVLNDLRNLLRGGSQFDHLPSLLKALVKEVLVRSSSNPTGRTSVSTFTRGQGQDSSPRKSWPAHGEPRKSTAFHNAGAT